MLGKAQISLPNKISCRLIIQKSSWRFNAVDCSGLGLWSLLDEGWLQEGRCPGIGRRGRIRRWDGFDHRSWGGETPAMIELRVLSGKWTKLGLKILKPWRYSQHFGFGQQPCYGGMQPGGVANHGRSTVGPGNSRCFNLKLVGVSTFTKAVKHCKTILKPTNHGVNSDKMR